MDDRRTFLKLLAATTAAPVALWGCGGDEAEIAAVEGGVPRVDMKPERVLPEIPRVEPLVRVRIRRMTAADVEKGVLVGERDQWLRVLHRVPLSVGEGQQDREIMVDRAQLARGPVSFSALERAWSVVDADGRAVRTRAFETLHVEPLDPESRLMRVDADLYPGTLRFVARPDLGPGEYDVVNHVLMEDYLPGVLARELFPHWHLHTHAAQAVAARSFAATEVAMSVNQRHYDVTSTTSSQAYIGGTQHQRAHDAVTMTRGVVLGYGTGLVSGYYSACCGGVAASALDVITDHPIHDIPPLMGREGEDVCREAPVYRWTISRPMGEVVSRMRAYGVAAGQPALADLARIESIEPMRWNAHQRPTHYVMHINGGAHVEMRADELRRAVDHAEEAAGLPQPAKRLFSSFIEAQIDGETLTIHGRGHGHGAGMCQYGAQALATSGKAFEEILQWYYPTVELVSGYT